MANSKLLNTVVNGTRFSKVFSIVLIAVGIVIAANEMLGFAERHRPLMLVSAALLALSGLLIWGSVARAEKLRAKADELNASQDRLREVSDFRQQFLANMSHEFRTPLNAIQGFAQAILHRQDEMSAAQIADYVRIIEKSARDLGALTDNVLDLSKLDAQKFELTVSDVDLTRLICNTAGKHSAVAGERSIKLNTDIADNWIVRADLRGLTRCLDSVISNAIKFSPDGKDIDLRAYRWGRRSFVVEVVDRGCGISEEDLENIWMVYARSSLTKKTGKIGAGLGLAITRALMDAHNGYIEIDSEEGKGTTVRLCFPNTMIVDTTYDAPVPVQERSVAS